MQNQHATRPILYSFRRCPYAIRARMALQYSGIAVELREVALRNKPQAMLQCSAKGTVPVLLLPNGQVIDESREIMQWALASNDPEGWLDKNDTDQYSNIINLLDHNDDEFKASLDRYKYADRYPENSAEHYRAQGELFLSLLENSLHQHRFLITNKISMADIGIFPFIRQFAYVDSDWFQQAPYPQLHAWLDYFLQSNIFLSTMDKYSPWQEHAEPIIYSLK